MALSVGTRKPALLTLSHGVKELKTSRAIRQLENAVRQQAASVDYVKTVVVPTTVNGTPNTLAMFTTVNTIGDSPLTFDGVTIHAPIPVAIQGTTPASTQLTVVDAHTGMPSSVTEVWIDTAGATFAGGAGGGGGGIPSHQAGLPPGATLTAAGFNAVATGSASNIAVYANAQGAGTSNYALFSPNGDLLLNAGNATLQSGNLAVYGTGQISGTLSAGATTISPTLTVTQAGADGGVVYLQNPNVQPAGGPGGTVFFRALNSASAQQVYASVVGDLTNDSNTVGDGKLTHYVLQGGVLTAAITSTSTSGVIANSVHGATAFDSTIDLGSHKILHLANGSASDDGAAFGQIGSAVNAAVSGTTNKLAKFTGANAVGNGWASDDGTTWGVSGKFAVDEASGRTGVGTAPDANDNLAVQATFRVKDSSSLLRIATDGAGSNYIETGASFVSDSKATLNFTSMLGATVYGKFDTAGLFTLNNGLEVAGGNATVDAGVKIVSKGTTAKAARMLLTGTDVLGTVNTTDGPELVLGLNLTNRKDLMLVDSTNTGAGAPALSISTGSAQGQYIQAVDIGWNTGQALGIQIFGGATTIGNGTNNCGVSGTFSCTGLVDLTGQSVYLGRQVLTAASGTYTPTTGTRKVLLSGCGPGGGGGGGAGGSSVLGAGGGGASGGWFQKWINPGVLITGGAYTNGTGGTAGANTGGNGGNGSADATIVIQGTTYTFKAGNGGTGMAAANTAAFAVGGTVNAGTSTGDYQTSGHPGGYGTRLVGPVGAGGLGGSSPFGAGGQGPNGASGAGTNATGFGAGGGGGVGGLTGQTGGTGSASIIIVDEWR